MWTRSSYARIGMTGLWQVRRDHAPLCVGQIGLVSGDGAAMLLSSGRRPHGESSRKASAWAESAARRETGFGQISLVACQ